MIFNTSRETPLHLAVLNDQEDEVRYYLEKQQWLHTQNAWGLNPLELAQYLGKKKIAALLEGERPLRHVKVVHPSDPKLNIYSVEEFEKATGLEYYFHLQFPSYKMLKKIIRNCPWTLKKTFMGEENRQLGEQYREQVRSSFVADVSIKWIDEEMGYGLFAEQDFPENMYIGEYTGMIRQLSRWRTEPNAYCFHYPTRFWSWNYIMIDGVGCGNELRFINHSDNPNLKPECLVDRGLLHQVLFTNEKIAKGTELTFDYGEDYWRKRKKKQR